jgi:hypothetical protein
MPDKDKTVELLQQLLETAQNSFILQALEAGVSGQEIRALLRIDKLRVSNVSKIRKKRKVESRG